MSYFRCDIRDNNNIEKSGDKPERADTVHTFDFREI